MKVYFRYKNGFFAGWEGTFPRKSSELFCLDWWMVWTVNGSDAWARESKWFLTEPGKEAQTLSTRMKLK